MEKLNDSIEKQPNEAEVIADDDDEVVEEDEEDDFGKFSSSGFLFAHNHIFSLEENCLKNHFMNGMSIQYDRACYYGKIISDQVV